MTDTIYDRIRDRAEALPADREPAVLTRDMLGDLDQGRDPAAEDVLANLLWFLADPEAQTGDHDLLTAVADAILWAGRLGIQWESGR